MRIREILVSFTCPLRYKGLPAMVAIPQHHVLRGECNGSRRLSVSYLTILGKLGEVSLRLSSYVDSKKSRDLPQMS